MTHKTEETKVIEALTEFIKGGDLSDLKMLDSILHPDFRNVQYGFFDKGGIFVIDKSRYLDLIEKGTFGGTPRQMVIESINIHEHMAVVKVKLESEALLFTSYIYLIRDKVWKVIENFPHVQYKSA